jgi:hypothetical protein
MLAIKMTQYRVVYIIFNICYVKKVIKLSISYLAMTVPTHQHGFTFDSIAKEFGLGVAGKRIDSHKLAVTTCQTFL